MKKSAAEIKSYKGKEKLSMITCYDYSFAKAVDGKIDLILVGDSLGNVILGYDRTKHVTMSDMIRHTEAVIRGTEQTHIIGDMPAGSYDTESDALTNAQKFIDIGVNSVKLEGMPEMVKHLCDNNIPVMGHLGLLPQTATKMGVVGRDSQEAKQMIADAKQIEEAGAFALVLESVPTDLAKEISESISIPTIGIGAGKYCDGQVLVLYDLIGLYPDFKPKFVRYYANLKDNVSQAVTEFSKDIKSGSYPTEDESFK